MLYKNVEEFGKEYMLVVISQKTLLFSVISLYLCSYKMSFYCIILQTFVTFRHFHTNLSNLKSVSLPLRFSNTSNRYQMPFGQKSQLRDRNN